jgi:hypothetical protein
MNSRACEYVNKLQAASNPLTSLVDLQAKLSLPP